MQGVPQHLRQVQVHHYLPTAEAVQRPVLALLPAPAPAEDPMQLEEDPMNVEDLWPWAGG